MNNRELDALILDREEPAGETVLRKVHEFLGRFVIYPLGHAQIAHTLWIAHAHLMDAWESNAAHCIPLA